MCQVIVQRGQQDLSRTRGGGKVTCREELITGSGAEYILAGSGITRVPSHVSGQLPLVQELPGPAPPGRVDCGEEDAGDGGDDQEDDEQRDQDQSNRVAANKQAEKLKSRSNA